MQPFIEGDKCYLRALLPSDLDGDYLSWLNDPEVRRFLESGVLPHDRERLEAFYLAMDNSPDDVLLAIIDRATDRHIGNIRLGPINWYNQIAWVGIMIGDKTFWGKGYASESIRLVAGYAFDKLNLHKLNAGVTVDNQASLKAFQKAGFEIEGQGRDQYFVDGRHLDSYYLGLVREVTR